MLGLNKHDAMLFVIVIILTICAGGLLFAQYLSQYVLRCRCALGCCVC